MAWLLMVAILMGYSLGAALRRRADSLIPHAHKHAQATSTLLNKAPSQESRNTTNISSFQGDFPICTDFNGPIAPFCLPKDGADVTVDATYYVTWNADFYPLNATITIELRYANSSLGDSAFTSEKTDNSYGYISLPMQKEWLQGKPYNALTLYIIELDPTSGSRASARQGPTVILHPKPIEHYKPSPQIPFNRTALYIGLPVSLGVVIAVVAGLAFGMRKSRRTGLRDVVSARGRGYGIGKSKNQRLGNKREINGPDSFAALNKYREDSGGGCSEFEGSEKSHGLERSGSFACTQEVSKLKSWSS
ncbi:hypothetical protein IFM61606_05495 [Aspergillus udagawae]|uniref:Uncharacterized protein n=1 Tax=Aspergillus udagawae TaxID=91492 RepID=A0ABQ1B8E7_9EURO|nr:hypothetical protein IFM53868_08303 [Aspergillus udagawae]GFG02878.1 hypothetical protein IFM5058_01154 [Aspergillus udagawae]GFG25549.1 hypothetical protein IFM61606_05495 [Aspergillus udagawae]